MLFQKDVVEKVPARRMEQCMDLSFRTNNWSESFNSVFSRRFARCHPNMYVTVDALKKVENEVHVLWNEFVLGPHKQAKADDYTNELERLLRIREER